jgi:hypothetical protein
MCGVFFGLALLFSPLHGLVARVRRLRRQRVQFASEALIVHLLNHERTSNQATESEVSHLSSELRWTPQFARQVMGWAMRNGLVERTNGHLALTNQGRTTAQQLARA